MLKEIDMNTLRIELARLLEVPLSELTDNVELCSFSSWDSLTQVTLVAFAVGVGKVEPDLGRLVEARTVKDLANVLDFSSEGIRT
jgi:hypothetical protein